MDFQQELITTIHDFGGDVSYLESRLRELQDDCPMSVLIPALYEEFERPALAKIRDHLKRCDYVKVIYVALGAKTQEEYRKAVEFFADLPQQVRVIWTDGPRITSLLGSLGSEGLDLLSRKGKGWAVWIALGIASAESEAIALHDADIITFNEHIVPRLLYPIAEKEFGIAYNKAYYTRLSLEERRMQGRAVRLFVKPILESIRDVMGPYPYLRYLRSFRYPLAGEFAMTSDLALNLRVPSDWGLEVGLLAEVYRNVAPKRVSQVDLGYFDHKHKAVGDSPSQGLQKMCMEILTTILRDLTEAERVVVTEGHKRATQVKYRRAAQNLIRKYFVDAKCNGIPYSRHVEEMSIELFEQVIPLSFERYAQGSSQNQLPDWTRILSVAPDFREQLIAEVEADTLDAAAPLPTDNEMASV